MRSVGDPRDKSMRGGVLRGVMKRAAAIVGLGIVLAACGSSSKPGALQSLLEKHDQIQLSPLPPHPTTISKHEAEEIASSNTMWTTPPGKKPWLSAALWRVRDPQLYIPEHGIHRLLVNNQVDWIVLVHGVNFAFAPIASGATGANAPTPQSKPVYGTAVVVINAESGRQVEWWPIPSRAS